MFCHLHSFRMKDGRLDSFALCFISKDFYNITVIRYRIRPISNITYKAPTRLLFKLLYFSETINLNRPLVYNNISVAGCKSLISSTSLLLWPILGGSNFGVWRLLVTLQIILISYCWKLSPNAKFAILQQPTIYFYIMSFIHKCHSEWFPRPNRERYSQNSIFHLFVPLPYFNKIHFYYLPMLV